MVFSVVSTHYLTCGMFDDAFFHHDVSNRLAVLAGP
jgi:hypothetical protein